MAESLAKIEDLTKTYADARNALADEVGALEDEIAAAKRRHLAKIRKLFDEMAEVKTELAAEIWALPKQFEKPRTRIFWGIKVGLQKQKGSVAFDDEDEVIKLIRKKFPDLADDVIKLKPSVVKSKLAEWTASDLKKIGVNLVADTDDVLISPIDGAVEKLLKALEADLDREIAKKD